MWFNLVTSRSLSHPRPRELYPANIKARINIRQARHSRTMHSKVVESNLQQGPSQENITTKELLSQKRPPLASRPRLITTQQWIQPVSARIIQAKLPVKFFRGVFSAGSKATIRFIMRLRAVGLLTRMLNSLAL